MYKVSVIIPCYNVEKYIRKCLDSVINQTLKDIEIICIDDGSTDSTLNILKEYEEKDNRLKILIQKNSGSASARNNGIRIAKGEYIGFVDADDYINYNFFEELYTVAIAKNADIAETNKIILPKNAKQQIKKCGISNNVSEIVSIFKKSKIIITTGVSCNKIYQRKFLKDKNINCIEINNSAEDNYFTDLAVIYANKIAINNNAEYYYIINRDSQTQKIKPKEDSKIFDIYNFIENRIIEMPISKLEKLFWMYVIYKRKKKNFKTYYRTINTAYKDSFKKQMKKNYCLKNFFSIYTNNIFNLPSGRQTLLLG